MGFGRYLTINQNRTRSNLWPLMFNGLCTNATLLPLRISVFVTSSTLNVNTGMGGGGGIFSGAKTTNP
jgi:hypothetical protein